LFEGLTIIAQAREDVRKSAASIQPDKIISGPYFRSSYDYKEMTHNNQKVLSSLGIVQKVFAGYSIPKILNPVDPNS